MTVNAFTLRFAALLVTTSVQAVASAAFAASPVVSYDIPVQPLPAALNLYARQSHVQIFFPSAAIAGIQSTPLKGRLGSDAALHRLLAGSGLEIASDDGRSIFLRAARRTGDRPAPDAPAKESDAASKFEEIVVTGAPRAGTLKRQSNTVVNTVTELEIKRLPNLDVSDVLARLPSVRRNDTQSGENRYVSIRGLDNAAASQSLDGVLLTNYIGGSRAVSTEALSSNFIKNITVTSTVTPDLDENSNSANVALTTISGLDNDGKHLLDLRGFVGTNSRSGGDTGTRQPLRFAGTWQGALDSDDRYGLAVGASIDRLGSRQDAVSVGSYSNINGNYVPNGAITRGETYSKTQRVSGMIRFDAKPVDGLALFAEYFLFNHDFSTDQHTATENVTAASVNDVTDDSGQFGRATSNYGFNLGGFRIRDNIFQIGADYDLTDKDKISFRGGATLDNIVSTNVSTSGFTLGSTALTTPIGYNLSGDGLNFTPGSSAATSNPANYRLGGKVTVGNTLNEDRNYFLRADYSHNVGLRDTGLGFQMGAQYKTLDRDSVQRGYGRVLASGQTMSLSEVTNSTSIAGFSPLAWNSSNFLSLINSRGIASPDSNGLYTADPADGYGQDYHGTEQIALGYGLLTYATDRFHLSAGVRAAHTHRTLDDIEPDQTGIWGAVHYRQSYWNVLPSAYGSYDITSQLKFRGAFTQTLERPAITSASRSIAVSYDTPVTRTVSYTDAALKPIRSTNFDASFEYYYGRHNAYFSIGAYSKYLRDIPATSSSRTVEPDGTVDIVTYKTNVTEVDGKKVYGRVRGVEALWSDPKLPFFPDKFGNLGVSLSYDYLVYQVTAINGGGGVAPTDTRLVDAAPRNYFNASLFYNKGPVALNLFYQIQSSVPSLSYNPANDKRTQYGGLLDLQASYAVTKNFRVSVEGRNLTDQNITDTYGVTGYNPVYQIKNNGRTLWFGGQLTF